MSVRFREAPRAAGAPLAGLRVVERADGLAATYAAFLLRELGAEVDKLCPVGAPRAPGAAVLDRGKRLVALERPVGEMVAGADAVVTDDPTVPVSSESARIHCEVSAFGDRGPLRELPDDHALLAAATGVQATQWSWAGRPVWLVTPIISYMTGMLAALGVTAATFARQRGAGGQVVHVSGLQGALALQSGSYITGPRHQGSLLHAGDPRGAYPTYGLYQTADGWLLVGALTQAFWVKLGTLLDRIDLLADERLAGNPLTFGAAELRSFVRGELEPIFRRHATAEWVARLRQADIPCGAVGTRAGFLADTEARALGFAVAVDDPEYGPTWQPGAPAAFSTAPLPAPVAALPTRPAGAAPPRRCLEGIRVIELASFIAGPFCPMLLADLGADVVKVESAAGDPFRLAAFAFVGWNRGKRSLVADLKRPEGRELFLDLVRGADVVVDNLRVGVMDRLGIGWETLARVNPRLVHTSVTGYGIAGPLATLPGFDPVFQARSGLMQAQGGDGEPVFHTIAYNDYSAGALAALATVAALVERDRTGVGRRVDVSLFRTAFIDQAAAMVSGAPAASACGGRDFLGPSAARRLYACTDGWACVSAATSAACAALAQFAGVAVVVNAPPDGAVARAIGDRLAPCTRADAVALLASHGVPAAACLRVDEVFVDAHLLANGCFTTLQDPVLGEVVLGGPLIDLARTPIGLSGSAPSLGGDAVGTLLEIGYSRDRIKALMETGVVGRPAPPSGMP